MVRLPLLFLIVLCALTATAARAQDAGDNFFDRQWLRDHSQPQLPATGPAPAKAAPPDAQARKIADASVKEVFGRQMDNATTSEQATDLARKMLATAAQIRKDLAARFVLCRTAGELAADAGDTDTAFSSVDELARLHDVDAMAMKTDLCVRLVRQVRADDRLKPLLGQVNNLIDQAMAQDRYDLCARLSELAVTVAARTRDPSLDHQTAARAVVIRDADAAYQQVKPMLLVLRSHPDDANANLAAGKYYCYAKGDWARGLPLLVRAGDGPLQALARLELTNPSAAELQLRLGDEWWNLAQKEQGSAAGCLADHAAAWYRQALPRLAGAAKLRVQKRLDDRDAAAATAEPHHVVDLLALIDPARDSVNGAWSRTKQGLESDSTTYARLRFPYKPPAEYDLAVECTRLGGTDGVYILLAARRSTFLYAVGTAFNSKASFYEIGVQPGQRLADNLTTVRDKPMLQDNHRTAITVQVRQGFVAAYIDGKLIARYQTDFTDMSMVPEWSIGPDVLGIGSWGTKVAFHSVRITEISGAGTIKAGPK